MLPLRLELKNFLAYRNPDPLNLENLHLACLTGLNGAGKTSLLDALTWALWGEARAKSDDDLIHIGQTEMQVQLDFSQDQQLYRVVRKRKGGSRKIGGGRGVGQSELNLFIWNPEREAWTLISEPRLAETQRKINHLLHLNYETFANSAFLQQGRADAFTTKSPGERKKILADILGLDRWAAYEEEVKDQLGRLTQEAGLIRARLEEIEREVGEEPALQIELVAAEEQERAAQSRESAAQALLDEVRGADVELRSAESVLANLNLNLREREAELRQVAADIEDYQGQIAALGQIVEQQAQIQAGYAQLEAARTADLALGDKLRELNELNQRVAALEAQLSRARQELELERGRLEVSIEKDQAILAAGDSLQTQLAALQHEIAGLEALEAEREAGHELLNTLNAEREQLRALNGTLEQEGNTLNTRVQMLQNSTAPECPVCHQPLNEAQKADLLARTQQTLEELRAQWSENARHSNEKEEQIKALKAQAKQISQSLKALPRLREELGAFEQQGREAQAAEDRIYKASAELGEIQARLQAESYAEGLRQDLHLALADREALAYNPESHSDIRQQLEDYQEFQQKSQKLELALNILPDRQKSLGLAEDRQTRLLHSLEDLQAKQQEQAEFIQQLRLKVDTMRLRQQEVERERRNLRLAEEKRISLQQRLRAIEGQKKRRQDLLARREALQQEEALYEQLKLAVSKNGIPAMLIEAAIPELEDAANRLLSRMTNNRMHLRMETQREKKSSSGGVIETLDIWIQDELGQRDYSLFSGGEAFRVNFALRIALSQLLARRAGAQLRTLIIDEGFGTQDEVGRERLIEAITSIQDDFDLLLVITHIEELKDAFPARIEVTKTPNGSLAVIR
jgi:exonuclease SbcC